MTGVQTCALPICKSYDVGPLSYTFADGLHYEVSLSNTETSILLCGHLTGTVIGQCARCLTPTRFEMDAEPEECYLLPTMDPSDLDLAEDEYEWVGDDSTIDISPAFESALVYATPQMILCKPSCKGLCPICGVNLNEETCDCADKRQPDSTNPFSVLKDYFDTEQGN